ncbi:MAG: YtxH domain-containing protein [Nitrospiraceae bacterium]|nr:MAG: YtxH domain-containing protein [Nitrospiraceae bacterium]
MRDDGYSSGSVLLSFLLGGVVGAGLALLFAPQSGRETRQKIRELADDVKDKTTDYANQAKEKVSSLVEEGKGYYDEKKSILKSAVDAGKEAYEKEKEKYSKG